MIKELHENLNTSDPNLGPEEGQRGFSCSNEESLGCPPSRSNEFIDENMDRFIRFASSLKKIHTRLLMEGYVIEEGRIYKP